MSENMLSEGNLAYLRTTRLTTMPDMLPEGESIEGDGLLSEHTLERYKSYSADIVHVDGKTIRAMLRRERELKMTSSVQKAFALSFGKSKRNHFS